MITITLNEDQAALVTHALMNVEAPWNLTNPIIMMIATEHDAAKALKTAVDAMNSKDAIKVFPKPEKAPYGLRKDGKPRGRPGRPRKVK